MQVQQQKQTKNSFYTNNLNGFYCYCDKNCDVGVWLAISQTLSFVTILCWIFFLTWGVLLFQDNYQELRGKINLPLKWFDRLIAQLGSLLPLLIWLWRYTLHKTQKQTIGGHGLFEALIVILGMGVLRVVLYLIHVQGEKTRLFMYVFGEDHLMSDHVLLGSSLVASYSLEIWNQLVELFSIRNQGSQINRRWAFFSSFVLLVFSGLLFLLTCVDMFYTARYFHSPVHTVTAAFLGIFSFQLPVVVWILQDGNRLQFYPVK